MSNKKSMSASIAHRRKAIENNLRALDLPIAPFTSIIEDLARAEAEANSLSDYLDRHGLTYTLPNGIGAPRPEVKLRNEILRRIDRLRSDLGLNTKSLSQLLNTAKAVTAPDLDSIKAKLQDKASQDDQIGLSDDQIDDLLKELF